MQDFLSFMEVVSKESCELALFRALADFCHHKGFDYCIYSLLTPHPSMGMDTQHGLISTYPAGWMAYYQEQRYLDGDPVVRMAKAIRWPFVWSETLSRMALGRLEKRIMAEGREAGLLDGICMTVEHVPGEIAGLALATAEKQFQMDTQQQGLLNLAFQHTHRRLYAIKGADFQSPCVPRLSAREQEILHWAAEGKSHRDIAGTIGISKSSVSTYLERCIIKLEAKNLMGAVVAAARLGIISPPGYDLLKQPE